MTRHYSAITIIEGNSKPVPYAASESALENIPSRAARAYNYRAAHAFAQMFGLRPGVALIAFGVDSMLFFANGFVSMVAAVVLAFLTFRMQQKWYGDDMEPAFVKALIVWAVTIGPMPQLVLLYVPAGIVGFRHIKGMTGGYTWLKAVLTSYGNRLRML